MTRKSSDAFRTIREVADWLEVPTHVLRFWESKFKQVSPMKGAGGRRYYRRADILLLGGIKELLHEQGMTIRGAQKMLGEQGVDPVVALSPEPVFDNQRQPRRSRQIIRHTDAGETVTTHTGEAGGIYALDDLDGAEGGDEPARDEVAEAAPEAQDPGTAGADTVTADAQNDDADPAEAPMSEMVPLEGENADPGGPDNIVPFGGAVTVPLGGDDTPLTALASEVETPDPQPDAPLDAPPNAAALTDPTRAHIAALSPVAQIDAAPRARIRTIGRRLRGLAARMAAEQDL